MERRDPDHGTDGGLNDPGSLNDPAGSENPGSSKAWQAIRRTLGRLVSHVGARTVTNAEREIRVPILQSDVILPPPQISAGDHWKPASVVSLAAVPQAPAGSRESNLLPTVTLAQGNYALETPMLRVMPIAGTERAEAKCIPLEWAIGVTHLPESFVRLPSSPVRVGMVPLLPLPKTALLHGWPFSLPQGHLLPLPRFREPRVRWGGDSVLRRMPLTRRGKDPGALAASEEVFGAERRRLAETVQLRPEEILLLGVYPDVPILAVERIVVEDEGRQLRLWLKPDVLRGRGGAHRITLLVGRQIATGKMLQAAL